MEWNAESVDPHGGCVVLCNQMNCVGTCETFTSRNGNLNNVGIDPVKSYKAC
jgi:hypothetical protein